jgi:hypothetical protein
MKDVLMRLLFYRLEPLTLLGFCFIVFASYLAEMIEFRLSPKFIRLGGVLLLALAIGLFLYGYMNSQI